MTINFERFIRAFGCRVRKVGNIRGAVISEIPPPLSSLYRRKRNDMITNYDVQYVVIKILKLKIYLYENGNALNVGLSMREIKMLQ